MFASLRIAQLAHKCFTPVAGVKNYSNLVKTFQNKSLVLPTNVQTRSFGIWFTNPKARIRTARKAVTKRFILTNSGHLKYKNAGKSHLNMCKSSANLRRKKSKKQLTGTWLKNMNTLLQR